MNIGQLLAPKMSMRENRATTNPSSEDLYVQGMVQPYDTMVEDVMGGAVPQFNGFADRERAIQWEHYRCSRLLEQLSDQEAKLRETQFRVAFLDQQLEAERSKYRAMRDALHCDECARELLGKDVHEQLRALGVGIQRVQDQQDEILACWMEMKETQGPADGEEAS